MIFTMGKGWRTSKEDWPTVVLTDQRCCGCNRKIKQDPHLFEFECKHLFTKVVAPVCCKWEGTSYDTLCGGRPEKAEADISRILVEFVQHLGLPKQQGNHAVTGV